MAKKLAVLIVLILLSLGCANSALGYTEIPRPDDILATSFPTAIPAVSVPTQSSEIAQIAYVEPQKVAAESKIALPFVTGEMPPPEPSPTFIPTPTRQPIEVPEESMYSLDNFVQQWTTGDSQRIVGVYVPGVLAYAVAQQPAGDTEYVYDSPGYVTQYASPAQFGVVGLLAHNYLGGSAYFNLKPGMTASVVYGDGHVVNYQINDKKDYQAITPASAASDFVPLDRDYTIITHADVYNEVYMTPDTLVFQTCIERDGDPIWGRVFIIANKIDTGS